MGKVKKTLKDVLGMDTRPEAREMSEETKVKISNFLADNSQFIVAVLDPETDVVVVGHRDILEAHRLVEKSTGKAGGIISDVLKYNKDDAKVKDSINQVLLLLDGAFHHIAKVLREGIKVDKKSTQRS